MSKPQLSIQTETTIAGIGLHSGNKTELTFKPAPENSGIVFTRTDLPEKKSIKADISHVVDITRGTTLGDGDVQIKTVEHVLAAIAGLELDNIEVELTANEAPVVDGSALPFVQALRQAGIAEQNAPKQYFPIERPISYTQNGVDLVVLPYHCLKVSFLIDYDHPLIGTQYATFNITGDVFDTQIAPARTFGFLDEVEQLKTQGLIKGGSLDNAVVIGKDKILSHEKLRFPNEFVRHKIVDLLGDLSLLGIPLSAHIIAAKSGHASHVELVKKLAKISKPKNKPGTGNPAPDNFEMDVNAIQRIMPHRYPFLLVDRIIEFEHRNRIVGIKNVTINEPFFVGHFPGRPVMPAVLSIEAMAQVGGLLLYNLVEDPEKKLVYFMGIDKARFRKPIVPGDQIRFEIEMLRFRRNTCKFAGFGFVDGELVVEAELLATIVDR